MQRFGDVALVNAPNAVEIGDGLGHPTHPMQTSGGKRARSQPALEQGRRIGRQGARAVDGVEPKLRVASHAPLPGERPGLTDTRRHHCRGVAGRAAQEVLHIGTAESDGKVETIEQRCGQPAKVAAAHRLGTPTGAGQAPFTTRARVHGTHQEEPSREVDRTSGAADPDHVLLERLAQGVEDRRRELAELVEKEDPGMRRGDAV